MLSLPVKLLWAFFDLTLLSCVLLAALECKLRPSLWMTAGVPGPDATAKEKVNYKIQRLHNTSGLR